MMPEAGRAHGAGRPRFCPPFPRAAGDVRSPAAPLLPRRTPRRDPASTAITGSLRSNRTKAAYCCLDDGNPVPLLATLTLISPAGGTAIAALAGCLSLYLAYKLFYRPDFGMPVRRRLLARGHPVPA